MTYNYVRTSLKHSIALLFLLDLTFTGNLQAQSPNSPEFRILQTQPLEGEEATCLFGYVETRTVGSAVAIPATGAFGCLDSGLQSCSSKFSTALADICEAMTPNGAYLAGFMFAVKVCEFGAASGSTNSVMSYGPSVSLELSRQGGGPDNEYYCYYERPDR